HQVQRIELAHQAVVEYKQLTQRLPHSQSDLVAMLPLFDTLYRAQKQLSDIKLPWLFSQVSSKHDQVMTAVPQLYQQALQMQFIPGLKNLLEEQLSSQRVMDPRYAYPTLKTYLMLGKPEQLNKAYFKAWFMRHFKGQPKVQEQLQKYLDIILAHSWVPIQLNPLLVSQTQQVLTMVPETMLAYVVLQDQAAMQLPEYQTILDTQDMRAIFADPMPSLYTKEGFDLVYSKLIPAVVKQVVETDQVLGEKRFSAGRKPDAVIQGVRDLYLIDYSKIWNKFISRLKLQPIRDLQQLDHVLQAAPVAFAKLEKAIVHNTLLDIKNPPPEAPNINDQFSEIKTAHLKPAIKQLQALQIVIAPVLKSDNLSQTALAASPKIAG
ncbi:MAG: ImcF-related family protein, partial [Gammaproteobacteria bacterium]